MRNRPLFLPAALTLIATATWSVPADAQFPDIEEAVEERAERELQRKAEEGIEALFRCVWNDLECIRGAEEDGEQVALTDEEGNVLTDEEGRPISDPAEAEAMMSGQEAGRVVGTIEMVVDGERRVFDVRQGPVDEGFQTGYNESVRMEAMVLGASLHGWDRTSGARMNISVGVWRETLEHMCDPFANQVQYSTADPRGFGKKLRPDGNPSETCPPPPGGGMGGLTTHVNLTEAALDEETGELHVVGTFAGPLGRGEDAMQVSEGRFEATLQPFGQL